MLIADRFRKYARKHPAEAAFAAPYLALLYCYNTEPFAWSNFLRFAIPVVPFALLALDRWIPRDRRLRVVWASLGAPLPSQFGTPDM